MMVLCISIVHCIRPAYAVYLIQWNIKEFQNFKAN